MGLRVKGFRVSGLGFRGHGPANHCRASFFLTNGTSVIVIVSVALRIGGSCVVIGGVRSRGTRRTTGYSLLLRLPMNLQSLRQGRQAQRVTAISMSRPGTWARLESPKP